jgi:membrane peptidoglycan carboxypeptidase
VIKPRLSTWSGYKGYIMNLVLNELHADGFSNKTIYDGGLRIYTTINQRLMNGLYSAVRQNVQLMAQEGVRMPSYMHIGAVLERPGTGQILAIYGGPGFGVKHCKKLKCQLDTVLAAEPVGSSFKPYVLATAVSQGMDVHTSVMNSHSPLCIPPDWTLADRLMQAKQTRKCSIPTGYWLFDESTENYRQNLTVPEATAYSNDPAYEDLIHRTGVQPVINMAAQLGVSSYDVAGLNALFGDGCLKHHPNCHPGSVIAALGAGSLTAVDQANTFATLVDDGTSVTPHVIRYIVQGTSKIPPKITRTHPLTPAQAADADFALSFDTTLPGATGLNAAWNRPVIAKTGTLGTGASASQAWFIGAIPQYSLSVGMFTDRPQAVPPQILDVLPPVGGLGGSYGGAWPAHIWHTFMTEQFNNLKVLPLPTPSYGSPPFFKWVQAPKPKPKPKRCPNGNGFGRGRGHRRPGPCPTPTPTPSGAPTPTPTPTPSGAPSPSPSVTPPGPNRQSGHSRAPGPKPAATSGFTAAVTLPRPVPRRPGWTVSTSAPV